MPPYNNHIMRYFIIMYAPTARPNFFASASAAGLFTRSPSALHANRVGFMESGRICVRIAYVLNEGFLAQSQAPKEC